MCSMEEIPSESLWTRLARKCVDLIYLSLGIKSDRDRDRERKSKRDKERYR